MPAAAHRSRSSMVTELAVDAAAALDTSLAGRRGGRDVARSLSSGPNAGGGTRRFDAAW